MTTLQIRISVSPTPSNFAFDGRDFIIATDGLLKRACGGSCVGAVTDGHITIEVRASSREEVILFVESYCGHFRREQRQVQIIVIDDPKNPLSETELAAGARLNAAPVKLTKSFFMKQPAGAFLASNIMGPGFEPVFAELIESMDARVAQWHRIRAAGANQRACHTFPSLAHFKQWQEQALEFFRSRAR